MIYKAITFVVLVTLTGCEAAGPRIHRVYPQSADALLGIAPECRNPTSAQYAACKKAAEMLATGNAQRATTLYLRNWEHVAFDDDVAHAHKKAHSGKPDRPFGGGGGGGSWGGLGNMNVGNDPAAALVCIGLVVVVVVVVVAVVAINEAKEDAEQARIHWASRLTTRTLEMIYEQDGGRYAQAMRPALSEVRYRDPDSYEEFRTRAWTSK